MPFVSFCFYNRMKEKDRESCSDSCRGTNLKQSGHKIEFGQRSMAYRRTQEKSSEAKNKFVWNDAKLPFVASTNGSKF